MRGEIAQFNAAGMDDALGKPIQIGALGAAVRHWVTRGRARPAAGGSPGTGATAEFDAGALVRAVGHNAQGLAGIRSAYLRRSRQDLLEMRQAVERAEWLQAGALAHRWKSASQAVGAVALAQRLHALEQACRDGGVAAGDIAGALQGDLLAVERWLSEPTPS